MMKKSILAAAMMTAIISGCSSQADVETAGTEAETTAVQETSTETAQEETAWEAAEERPEGAGEELTGKAQGFGGTITAYVTVADGKVTGVVLEGPDETPGIGGAALEELAEQFVQAGGADIDGVSGATVTSQGAMAAVRDALDPEANPYEEPEETEAAAYEIQPVEFPDDKKIVSATTYGIYTKDQASLQDAVISFTGNEHGSQVECDYARYLQIGDIVWTGELGSDPACEQAVVYTAEIDGKTVRLNDYVAAEEGGEWYHEAALEDVYILKAPEKSQADSENVASVYQITYKETNGHGEAYWMSDLKFSGNMGAIKDFVTENGFGYDYYRDGGITQNQDKYWQTPDAISGATLDETPTYLDILKLLYERIQSGEYTEEN